MRRIRGSFHLALTLAGTALIIYAVVGIEGMYDRMLVVALGIVLIEAGIWRITQSLFPNDRNFRPLRKETDFFITLVRRLNRAAVNAQRGSAAAADELTQIHSEMHHSVDRMLRLAGLTEEDLGFRYSPQKTELPSADSVGDGSSVNDESRDTHEHADTRESDDMRSTADTSSAAEYEPHDRDTSGPQPPAFRSNRPARSPGQPVAAGD